MTIKEVITILDIKDVPFFPQTNGIRKQGALPIYPTKKGICYWKEESIWSIGINEGSKNEICSIKQRLKEKANRSELNDIELDKYVAVDILLTAINQYNHGKGEINFDTIKYSVDKLNKTIYEALDFQQISGMDTLKESIMSDPLYRELLFCVYEVDNTKEMQYTMYKKDEKKYSFGNIKYHEELDIVSIDIYDDCVELYYKKLGRRYERTLDRRRSYTLEEKIFSALDYWECAVLN